MKKEVVVLLIDGIIYMVDVEDSEKKVTKLASETLIHDKLFITFQSDELVNCLKDCINYNAILDFECLDIQIRLSLGFDKPSGKWTIPNMFHFYLGIEERSWRVEEYVDVLHNLVLCYQAMKERGAKEWERVLAIELPVNKVLYETQNRGIYINHDNIEPICSELHHKIYSIKNDLQLSYNFVGDSLESYIQQKGIYRGELTPSIEDQLTRDHPELVLFKKLRRAKQNFNCLIMLSAIRQGVNLSKPIFKGFGTTTGRIILRDPALQNLSKQYRALLKNEGLPSNQRYVYIDYGQFEAGVLAGLIGNKKFQLLYEQDEVYEELAKRTKSDRDKAKMFFYCFVYGGIVWKGAESFFQTYGLQKSVDRVLSEAVKNGFIETKLGNRRICRNDNDKKWILNHYVQGTASLIFKQALIDVHQVYPTQVQLVLPMHDAALYIVDNDVTTESLVRIFRDAFKKWLPTVNPIVKEKVFFGDS